MNAKLSDEEFAQLTRYKTQLETTQEQVVAIQKQADKQIAQLVANGDEVKDVLNTVWLAANRRVMLEDMKNDDPEFADVEFPPMVNDMGELMVNLKARDKTAHWESVHDSKRIAVGSPTSRKEKEEVVQESSEKPSTTAKKK